MTATLSIEGMSVTDKLRTMELLWDDLRKRAEMNVSPDWHGEELERREQALGAGRDRAEDWNDVKRSIRDSLA